MRRTRGPRRSSPRCGRIRTWTRTPTCRPGWSRSRTARRSTSPARVRGAPDPWPSCPSDPAPTGRPEDADPDLWAALRRVARQAACGGGLPPSRRPALRRGRRDHRRDRGRGPPRRRRRHQALARRLSETRGEDEAMNTDTQLTRSCSLRCAPTTPQTLQRLQARLADTAERDGLLDVAYRTMDSPVGPAAARGHRPRPGPRGIRPAGPRRRAEPARHRDQPAGAARTRPPRPRGPPARRVLHRRPHPLRRRARPATGIGFPAQCARTSARHRLRPYRDIRAGGDRRRQPAGGARGRYRVRDEPGADRGACHRVVRSDGTWGQYAGGADAKAALLTLEAA